MSKVFSKIKNFFKREIREQEESMKLVEGLSRDELIKIVYDKAFENQEA